MQTNTDITAGAVQLAQDINTRNSNFMMHYDAEGVHMGHDILTEWSPAMTRDAWFAEENISLSHPGRADAQTYMTPREAQDRINAFRSTSELLGPNMQNHLDQLAAERGFTSYQNNVNDLSNGYVPPSFQERYGYQMESPSGEIIELMSAEKTIEFEPKPPIPHNVDFPKEAIHAVGAAVQIESPTPTVGPVNTIQQASSLGR